MQAFIGSEHEFLMEIWSRLDGSSVPVYQESIACDLPALVEETFVHGVLSGELPNDAEELRSTVVPRWASEPFLDGIEVQVSAKGAGWDEGKRRNGPHGPRVRGGGNRRHSRTFSAGPWGRRALRIAEKLRAEGTLGEKESAHALILARRSGGPARIERAPLFPLEISSAPLEDIGVSSLGAGSLVPDRPVLVNARAVRDGIRLCQEAGTREAGAAMLGKLVRLPEPLSGTRTRVVTVLSAVIPDPRHQGEVGQVTFDPEALVEAERVAELRGRAESVFTILHTHGWGECQACNRRSTCPLPECTYVSDKDYTVMETLFSSKAAVMPIVGRSREAKENEPVLAIHAWRGGELRSIRWQEYEE
jgi:hypothetical protein